jgi:prepilin-type N-terminal cleavage/methylation domain-containing protein
MNKLVGQAFTLIELLVVIAIIGILSGLIVVSMSGVTSKANIARMQIFSNSLRNSLMSDLIGEWKFDGPVIADGSTVTTSYTQDTWGTNNANSIIGTPKIYFGDNCVSGSCLYFDGSSNVWGGSSLILSQAAYTVEGWIKIPSGATGGAGRFMVQLGSSFPRFSPCFATSYQPLLYLSGENYRYGTSILKDNKWHHMVFVVTGSLAADINNSKIYVDGKAESAGPPSVAIAPVLPNGSIVVGAEYYGYIDGIRVYDVAMSAFQVQKNYYVGLNRLLANDNINKEEYMKRIEAISYK